LQTGLTGDYNYALVIESIMKKSTVGSALLRTLIAQRTNLSPDVVEQVLAAYDEIVIQSAQENARVRTLGGFIQTIETKATARRNPKTGELMNVPAGTKLVFKIPKKR
jgi:nucleoid DNA-binding protein